MHAHSDFALLAYPSAEAKIRQGVTTEVTGMCGFSPAPAPLGGGPLREWAAFLSPTSTGSGPALAPGSTGCGRSGSRQRRPFVGHGTLRIAAMGIESAPRPSDEARRHGARSWARRSTPAPSACRRGSSTPERLRGHDRADRAGAQVGRRSGRLYTLPHPRRRADAARGGIAEAIRIGDEGGVPVQIST